MKKGAGEKKKVVRRGPKGMPEPVDAGLILTDLCKKQWKLGKKIDQGGFGYLYLGSDQLDGKKDENFVIKVEPHSNGPLFVELAFYHRAAKSETISNWKKSHHLKHLGIPPYIGSGSFEDKGTKFRFLVMDRFAENVEQKFLNCDKSFSLLTILSLGTVIVECLEFLHENEYVHADIKGSNLLTGYGKKTKDQVYLVDYGLAYRYSPEGRHVVYKEDPKRKHDGTIEFTSRDAHKGLAPSRRGDLEILGYCMLEWLAGCVPWEKKIKDKESVFREKEKFMKDISKSLRSCCAEKLDSIAELEEYLKYVNTLQYDEKPDYRKVLSIFSNGMKKRKLRYDGVHVQFETGSIQKVNKRPLPNGTKGAEKEGVKSPKGKKIIVERTSPRKPLKSPTKDVPARKVRRTRRNRPELVDAATSP